MNFATDERQIRQLFEQLTATWNAADHQRYASFFTDDCEYIASDAQYAKGRQAIADLCQQAFRQGTALVPLIHELNQVRFLSPDIALVQCTLTQLGWSQEAAAAGHILTNILMLREQAGWTIAAFQCFSVTATLPASLRSSSPAFYQHSPVFA